MKKQLLALVLLGTVSYGGYRLISSGDETAAPVVKDGETLVLDRIWIDHLPRNERDTIHVFAAISEEPFGVFQAASQWKGQHELFRYEAKGNELKIVFPQNNDRETVKHNAKRCSENGMDFCLEMSGASRGVKRYYSRKGWEIEHVGSAAELAARAEALISTLAVEQ
jgi:hypothetical protein